VAHGPPLTRRSRSCRHHAGALSADGRRRVRDRHRVGRARQQWGELAFGAGFFTWLAIKSVLLHRLYTAAPLAPPLRPTLGIQLAPPAVGAVCYLSVSGGHSDLFAHMLIGYALLQALLLVRMGRWIAEQPFAPSYWAFTFGATALAGATIRLSTDSQGGALAVLAPVLFGLANLIVIGIAAGTIWLLLVGKLLPPAPAQASAPATPARTAS
jgi:tellurite resistance protein